MSRLFFFLLPLLISANAWSAKTVFKALTGVHNVDMWTEVQDVPDPSFVWTGNNPTGSDGSCVATGSPVQVDTPFSGLKASRMAANKYYTCGDHLAMSDHSKISMVSITRRDLDANDDRIASHRTSTGPAASGWTLYQGTNELPYTFVVNPGGNSAAIGQTQAVSGWLFSCGTINQTSGLLNMHDNGKQDVAASAIPVGSFANDGDSLIIGGHTVPVTGFFFGDIALFAGWEGYELTYAQCKALFHNFFDLYESRGKTDLTWSNTGPTGAWDDSGVMWTYTDDFPKTNVAIPAGMTGYSATPPTCGVHLHPSVTNYCLSSQDLSTDWSEVGTCLSTSTTGTPRGNGQEFYVVTDNDAGASERVQQVITALGISPTDKFDFAILVRGLNNHQFTVRTIETTGALCGTPFEDFNLTISGTDWQIVTGQYTWTDANCSNMTFAVRPHLLSDGNAGVGSIDIAYVYAGVNAAQGTLFCDTTGAAVTCGADQPADYYDNVNNLLMTSAGEFKGNYRVLFDYIPMTDDLVTNDNKFFEWYKDGNDRLLLYALTNDYISLYHVDGGVTTGILTVADPGWTAGTKYTLDTYFNFTRDRYRVTVKGIDETIDTDSLATPSGMTRIRVGNNLHENGMCLSNFRIDR